uniref:DUF4974 domain-containing protein n=1 Tax=Roseihalotalea indica TaxID=2867963 RepID=A0AA49JIL1_9BACT|nr:DUF4974 domain-containing protein [Tunicatimonas sp. TK19036]
MPQNEDIYKLVSKYLANELDQTERAAFEQWRESHPEEYEKLKEVWFRAGGHRQTFSTNTAREKLNQRIDALEAETAAQQKRQTHYWVKMAASISILAIFLGTLYFLKPWEYLRNAQQARWVEKSTVKSQIATLTLGDGTKVTLNADSRLRYSSQLTQEPYREVFLEGEAFFEVAHDPEHPFLVRTGELTTRVLGTSFSISAYPDDEMAKVTVASGEVEVDLPGIGASPLLLPEKQISYHRQEKTWEEADVVLADELGWTKGRLVFENAKLSRVARVLERYYDVPIDFEEEKLKNCQITAHFEKEKLPEVLEVMSYINDFTYTFDNNQITLSGSGCEP